jgi:hypothetical protein
MISWMPIAWALYFLTFLVFISEFKLKIALSDTINWSRKPEFSSTVFTNWLQNAKRWAGSPSLNFYLWINMYGWKLRSNRTIRWNVRQLNTPFFQEDRWPFSVRDCRTNSMFSAVRPLRPLLRLWQESSCSNFLNVLITVCLLGAGMLLSQ